MAWFRRKGPEDEGTVKKVVMAEGLWIKCDSCKEIVYRAEVERGIALMGIERNAHIQNVIEGLRTVADTLEIRAADLRAG